MARFGEDGKMVISRGTKLCDSPFSRIVEECDPDGSYTIKRYAKDNGENLVALEKRSKDGTLIKKIRLHKGTKQPKCIIDFDKQGNDIRTQEFDINGNLIR